MKWPRYLFSKTEEYKINQGVKTIMVNKYQIINLSLRDRPDYRYVRAFVVIPIHITARSRYAVCHRSICTGGRGNKATSDRGRWREEAMESLTVSCYVTPETDRGGGGDTDSQSESETGKAP